MPRPANAQPSERPAWRTSGAQDWTASGQPQTRRVSTTGRRRVDDESSRVESTTASRERGLVCACLKSLKSQRVSPALGLPHGGYRLRPVKCKVHHVCEDAWCLAPTWHRGHRPLCPCPPLKFGVQCARCTVTSKTRQTRHPKVLLHAQASGPSAAAPPGPPTPEQLVVLVRRLPGQKSWALKRGSEQLHVGIRKSDCHHCHHCHLQHERRLTTDGRWSAS